jgi:hypothetical protein
MAESAAELRGELEQIQEGVNENAGLFAGHETNANEATTAADERINGTEGVDTLIGQTDHNADLASTLADALAGESGDLTEELGRMNGEGSRIGELAAWMGRIAAGSNNDSAAEAAGHLEEAEGASEEARTALSKADKAVEEAAEAAAGAAEDFKSALGKLTVLKAKLEEAVASFTESGQQDGETKAKLEAASGKIDEYLVVI